MGRKKTIKSKAKSNDVFDNISNSLDTSFDGEEIEELVDVKEQSEKCSDLVNTDNTVSIEDGQYIKEEIKSLVSNIEEAMVKLQQDIRIGSPARQHEVFAQLANAKANAIKELLSMNKILLDAKMKIIKKDPPRKVVNNNIISSSELLKMVNNAKKNNSLNEVEAKFKIEKEKNLE